MNENVNVCVTPKGEKPVLHFSQFDNGRIFTVTVLADDGETAAVLTDLDIEFRLRKTDSHVVTVVPESVTDNVITFKTTEQMCACCGQNIASVVLMDDTNIISTLDILVDIQRDILSGGLTSESDIRNLTTQIEQIVPEVIGDDYYTKDQVDEIIADIPTFDPSNYYDKSDVDGLLADKANSDDVYTKSDVYNKTETDNLLADKADSDDVYTKSETDDLLADKANTSDLAAVATSGSYDDLINKPYIPNTYSTTEEQIVGTWIDGRPIYRKVFNYESTMSPGGWFTIGTVENIDGVINGWAICNEGSSGRTIGKRDMYLMEANPNANAVQIYNATSWAVYIICFVCEYIKSV